MTILARTRDHLVEFEAGFLSIARYTDGHCKAWKKVGISAEFRADCKRFGADRTVETYLQLLRRAEWEPLYQPQRMPGADPAWDVATSAADDLAKLPHYAIGAGAAPLPVGEAA